MSTIRSGAERRLQHLYPGIRNNNASSSSSTPAKVMGHPSTMPDRAYQLSLTPYVNRGALLQPDSGVYTKIENGYSFQSYRDISIKGKQLAAALRDVGVGVGGCVGTFMYNNGRHLLLHYTTACAGLLLSALNFRLSVPDLTYIINHMRLSTIFVDSLLLRDFEKLDLTQLPTVKTIVVCGANEAPNAGQQQQQRQGLLGSAALRSACTVFDFDALQSRGRGASFVWPDLDERTGCNVCFTSGTTGRPKGVVASHRSTAVHLMAIGMTDFVAASGTDCWMPLAPMFHATAWCIPYLALCLGCKVVLNNQYSDAKREIEMICEQGVTIFSGVPTVLQAIRMEYESNVAHYEQRMKGVLSRVIAGGSSPPSELITWYRDVLGVEVVQIWGMTELNPFGTVARRMARRRDLGRSDAELTQNQKCPGLPLPSLEIKVVDADNYDVELPWDGESVGELLARGVSVCNAYYNVSAETLQKKFHRGWLVTGDLATRTQSGQLVIKDRSKDMIKSGGEWISSVDLEGHVMGMRGVDKACVVAVKHRKWMQRPIVIVVLKPGVQQSQVSLAQIRQHCLGTFAKFQLPDDVLYWDEIPLTGTGKMSKKDVRALLDKRGYVHPQERTTAKL